MNEAKTKKADPLIKEILLNAPVPKVWKAITDTDDMKQWYFDITGFKPEVGSEFQFEGGKEDKCYLHLCKIAEIIPGKRLSYTWRYDGYPGNTLVTFELFEEGDKTRLRLTHKGLETLGDNPDFARENFVEGWTYLIEKAIKEFVEK
jgi:uncharacterized protein YndB with AHSA1/START domain